MPEVDQIYIIPRFNISNTPDENPDLQDDLIYELSVSGKEKAQFKDIYNESRLYILGDPGFGKSRLLEEIVIRIHQSRTKSIR